MQTMPQALASHVLQNYVVLQSLSGKSFQLLSTNTEDSTRLDVCAWEYWDKSRSTAYFDVKVINAHILSNSSSSTASCYHKHEMDIGRTDREQIHTYVVESITTDAGRFSHATSYKTKDTAVWDKLYNKHWPMVLCDCAWVCDWLR